MYCFSSATVVDGTGAPRYVADVTVQDGVITRIDDPVERNPAPYDEHRIDCRSLVLAPGFIDIHTHYDAQLFFEPTASPSSWHGVTTVVTGNCGFSLAPSRPADKEWLLRSLARVEGMHVETLLEGVGFTGGSMRDYLGNLRGALGVNVVALTGHCALRRLVMGADASQRAATRAEIESMCAALADCLRDGSAGFSSAQLDIHADHQGLPVPSNLAEPDELIALSAVLADYPGTIIEFSPRSSLPGYTDADRELVIAMATASQAPVNVNMIDWFPGFTNGWRTNLATAESAAAQGLQVYPMLRANPQDLMFSLEDTFIFDDVAPLRDALVLDTEDRARALQDPTRRDEIRLALAQGGRSIEFSWDQVTVASTGHLQVREAQGRTIAELTSDGADGLDTMLDLAVADGFATVFRIDRSQGDAHRRFRETMARHPLLIAGASDGGAHLQTFCGADYPTRMLRELVPQALSLEEAIHHLSGKPAAMLSLHQRGTIAVGHAADLVLFDPADVGVASTRFVRDLPANGQRLVHEPRGYAMVMVNGEPILSGIESTGNRPGLVLIP